MHRRLGSEHDAFLTMPDQLHSKQPAPTNDQLPLSRSTGTIQICVAKRARWLELERVTVDGYTPTAPSSSALEPRCAAKVILEATSISERGLQIANLWQDGSTTGYR
jgi:hypothetical protein